MGETVTQHQAARHAGVSATSVKRWIDSGKLKAKKDKNGQWSIDMDQLRNFLATVQPNRAGTGTRHSVSPTSSPVIERGETVPDHRDTLIQTLKETMERERRINDELREQLRRFESEIFKLSHEMQALLSKDSPTGVISRWVKSKIS